MMCRVLMVYCSGFYRWVYSLNSERRKEDNRFKDLIKILHAESYGSFGIRRMTNRLRAQGIKINQKRIRRLMRELGLQGKGTPKKKKFIPTTDSSHTNPIAPNHLGRQFTVSEPNRWWVGDITYIWTDEGWAFLAIVLDLFSRKVVGWAMDKEIKANLVIRALENAVISRQPGSNLTFHSDRGVQYASSTFRSILATYGIRQSMSRKANCWDNAVSESFFGSIKTERIQELKICSFQHAKNIVFDYIETFYNKWRPHSFLLKRSPNEWEHDTSLNPHLILIRNSLLLK